MSTEKAGTTVRLGDKDLYTVEEARQILRRKSINGMYKHARSGKPPRFVKLGRNYLVSDAELRKFISGGN